MKFELEDVTKDLLAQAVDREDLDALPSDGQCPDGSERTGEADASGEADGVTEAAHVLAEIAISLADRDREDLYRLLGHDLAAPAAAALRHAKLGLLVRLLSEADDEQLVSPQRYEQERLDVADQGETWPSQSSIRDAYGTWATALRCAMGVRDRGSGSRVPHNIKHSTGTKLKVTRQDILDAIGYARRTLGVWPTEWEYEEWAKLTRRQAHANGAEPPRLPSVRHIRNVFGDFATAVEEVRRTAPIMR